MPLYVTQHIQPCPSQVPGGRGLWLLVTHLTGIMTYQTVLWLQVETKLLMWSHHRFKNFSNHHPKTLKPKVPDQPASLCCSPCCLGTLYFSVPFCKTQSYLPDTKWWCWTFSEQAFQSHRALARVEQRRIHVNKFYIYGMFCIWHWIIIPHLLIDCFDSEGKCFWGGMMVKYLFEERKKTYF